MKISSSAHMKLIVNENFSFYFYHGYHTPENGVINFKPSFYIEYRQDANSPLNTYYLSEDQINDLVDNLEHMIKLYQACPKDYDAR